ncbi:MAG: PHB depolymerase family esterase [Myxococcales bacterium]|nr:PHB depolymerase family esterase [Myxococcales bacterium]
MSRRARLFTLLIAAGSCGVVTWTCAHRPSSAKGHLEGRLEHGGRTRTFISWSPEGPGPFPLVVALHGRLGTGAQMLKLSGLTALAAQEHFIVVYPDGIDRSWADGRKTSPASKQGVDDVAFLRAVIDEFVTKRSADPARVYVLGMSNGGFMALTLACQAADQVTAVGSVTGFMAVELAKSCSPTRAVPVAIIAGDTDPLVPFAGGELEGGRGAIAGADDTFALWRRLDGCDGAPIITALPDEDPNDGTRVERREVSSCRDGSRVRLDVVKGGGHTWPRGDRYLPEGVIGKTSRDLDASAELWRFFAPHHK